MLENVLSSIETEIYSGLAALKGRIKIIIVIVIIIVVVILLALFLLMAVSA